MVEVKRGLERAKVLQVHAHSSNRAAQQRRMRRKGGRNGVIIGVALAVLLGCGLTQLDVGPLLEIPVCM